MAGQLGKVVIVGGGMMGCSTAFHLTQLGASCTVIERCSVACGASGKAGGFLARTWCDGQPVGPLARESFDLHKQYGAMFECDYRALDTLRVDIDANGARCGALSLAPDWVDQKTVTGARVIGTVKDTAQVHPGKLCQCFMREAQKKGCELIIDQVTGIEFAPEDEKTIRKVKLSGNRTIPCDILVLAMGPWTNVASQWFDHRLPVIGAQRAHSIVMIPREPVTAHALFVDNEDVKENSHSEVYPRPDGSVYICGYVDNEPLPESADLVTPNPESVKGLEYMAKTISSKLGGSPLEVGQACYLPLPPNDAPAIGRLPDYKGKLYIAAGHHCWGILNGPATGKGLAELIANGHSSIDLSPFDPALCL